MKNAERLAHPCPKCHAKAGAPCVDHLGDPTPRPHKTRGPGQLEAHKAAEAERINARARASYGPLFQFVADAEVKPVAAVELIERDRLAAARSFDAECGPSGVALLRQCNKGMEWLYVHHLARELERLAGEAGRLFAEHSMRTYPLDYQRMMFKEFMTTTTRRQIGPYRVPADNSIGCTIAYRHTWSPASPLMTPEEFDRLYPQPEHWRGLVDAPEPDDGGLLDRFMAAIGRAAELRAAKQPAPKIGRARNGRVKRSGKPDS